MSTPYPFTGGCHCGAVRYEVTARPLAMLNCHCRDCQQMTGGAYTPVVYVLAKHFRITQGTLKHYTTPSENSGSNLRGFCAECGSRLTGAESERGIGIAASSLDDPSWFRPKVDLWVGDAQPWDVLDANLPKHEKFSPPQPASMITPPEIVHTTAQLTAMIPIVVAREEIQNVMGPGIQELMATLAAQNITPAGPWFTHHRRRPTETFDFEISIPVTAPVTAAGRVLPSEWPAMKVARTVYQGGFEGLGEAWGEFLGWIETQGLKTTDDLWECYLSGPEASSDPATYRTQLNRPLRD